MGCYTNTKYGTAPAGLNFAHKKYKFCMVFAQNSCLTTITLLRGPNKGRGGTLDYAPWGYATICRTSVKP